MSKEKRLEEKVEKLQQENKQLKIDLDYQKKITADKVVEADKYIDFLNDEIIKLKKELADWKDGTMIIEYEKQLAEKDKEIEELKEDYRICNNLRKLEFEINNNYRSKKYSLDKPVEELRKIKLSMPEKEWYYKGFDNCERQFACHIAELTLKLKTLRHQVCQEIREYCKNNFIPIPNKLGCYVEVNREEFFDNLDQIEGEK